MKALRIFLMLYVAVMTVTLSANNLQITNGSRLSSDRTKIVFTVSWDNSWYVTGYPANHDAVWIFIKYRQCGITGEWTHALLETTTGAVGNSTAGNHTLGSAICFAQDIKTTDRLGNAGNHNTGIMIRRKTIGTGNISNQVCTLKVVGGRNSSGSTTFDAATEYDICVFGIEMVQIPQGSFYLGDINSTAAFTKPSVNPRQPFKVTTEGALGSNVAIWAGDAGYPVGTNFPKGYNEFYCMKYEITQGQYVDFLNTLNIAAYTNRFPNYYNNNMHMIQQSGATFSVPAAHKDRACNYLSYNDICSYLDWAALRPMTEFEYEKICRGPLDPIDGEYAWGSTNIVEVTSVTGATAGVEVADQTNANANYNWWSNITGGAFGSGNQGPVGVGIFARDATLTREATGATYYGVMEMSGNVEELAISHYNNSNAASVYTGVWGDGVLTTAGLFNAPYWPAADADGYWAMRGGYWADGSTYLRVSDRGRYNYYYSGYGNYRSSDYGGRGVR